MKKIILVLAVLFCVNVSTVKAFDLDEWSKADTVYQATFMTLMTVDWFQTKLAVKDGMRELNPILGDRPSLNEIDAFGGAVMVAHCVISRMLPKEYRRKWQILTIGIETQTVYHNYNVGVRIEF